MVAPVEQRVRQGGLASLEVRSVCGESAVVSSYARSPMKLLAPRARGQSVWAYTSSFGGGIVAGDQTRLDVRLGAGTRCFFGTQAATKVYRNPAGLPTGHETSATLDAGSFLVFAPDPVQAFARSLYAQRQRFQLAPDATLVLLDWFTSGRAARGERWEWSQFSSRNEVHVGNRCVFLDALRLSPDDGELTSSHRLGRFNCLATLLLTGPLGREAAKSLLEVSKSDPVRRRSELVSAASPFLDGAVLRFAGEDVEAVGRAVYRCLAPLAQLLGDDPWSRKW